MKSLGFLSVLVAIAVLGSVSGCGSAAGPNPQTEQTRLNKVTQIRALFDKSKGGDFSSLSAEDQTEFTKLCNNDKAMAETTWNGMKNGPSGPAGATH